MPQSLPALALTAAAVLLIGCAAGAQEASTSGSSSAPPAATTASAAPSPAATMSPLQEALAELKSAEETPAGYTPRH